MTRLMAPLAMRIVLEESSTSTPSRIASRMRAWIFERLLAPAPHRDFGARDGESRGLPLMHHEAHAVLEPAHLAIDDA